MEQGSACDNELVASWKETVYPTPNQPLVVSCVACGTIVTGGLRGTQNIRSMLKVLKRHEEDQHPPYDRDLIPGISSAVSQINAGPLGAVRVGRYSVDVANRPNPLAWREEVEVLAARIGQLILERDRLQAALDDLSARSRNIARDNAIAKAKLIEALKDIDVLTAQRDVLIAELRKNQPNKVVTRLLAGAAKMTASALLGAVASTSLGQLVETQSAQDKATIVVEQANVVIAECSTDDDWATSP